VVDPIPLARHSDSDLEQRLVDVGPELFPTTPDLAPRVRRQLESEHALTPLPTSRSAGTQPVQDRRGGTERLPSPRSEAARGSRTVGHGGFLRGEGLEQKQFWLVAALLLIAITAGLVLFPETRNAIADRLGLQGVLIRWIDEAPTPEPSKVGAPLLLGRPVNLADAQAAVDFPVRVPTAAGFNTPREIYLLDLDPGEMVSFVYPAGPGLPASDETGVGALLTQFKDEADRNLIEKGLLDNGAEETHLEAVTVSGKPGFWISGAPHAFFFVCYNGGECRQERYHLAGNVLIWEQDGVTLRFESALTREDALAVAESISTLE